MLNIFQALIYGIVEGITEFLPISSTGHMVILSALLHIPETDFVKSFEIFIQLGAILAVVIIYAKTLIKNMDLLGKVIVGFIPTGIIGLTVYKIVKSYLLGNVQIVLWSLVIGGILMILVEKTRKKASVSLVNGSPHISYKDAALIGLFQAIAIIPGVSRSAATIIGGMLLGYSRQEVVEFSFMLAIPTMLAASGLDLLKSAGSFNAGGFGILAIGFIAAFVTAWFAVKWLLKFIQGRDFVPFGIYRIIVGIIGFLVIFAAR